MKIPDITFHDGRAMPQLGFGVWEIPNGQTRQVVEQALATGYRSIDTAAIYGNESGVGEALAASVIPRSEMFITTKLWNDQHHDAEKAFMESLKKLRLDYVDLYLIHWPAPQQNLFVQAWKALIKLQAQGLIRSIGVSNFTESHLQRLMDETGVKPVLNQIELHPQFQQSRMRAFHHQHQIVTESWSPLGKGAAMNQAVMVKLAAHHRKTPAQIVLRWHMALGLVAIPKSVTPSRIRENMDIFDFSLSKEELAMIATLDMPNRIGFDPEHFG